MRPTRHQPSDVSHIHKQIGTHTLRDFAHSLKINHPRISRGPRRDHLRPLPQRYLSQLIVIDPLILSTHSILTKLVEPARKIRRITMRQMASMRQIHPQYLVTRLQHTEINRRIRLRARVRLHVGELRPKQLTGPVDRELLHLVHFLTATIPALPRVALCVFIGQTRSLRRHHRTTREVFRRNQLDMRLLPPRLTRHHRRHRRVRHRQIIQRMCPLIHLAHPPPVPAIVHKRRAQPRCRDLLRQPHLQRLTRQTQHIRRIVLTRRPRRLHIRHQRRLNATVPICRNAHPNASRAHQNTRIGHPTKHPLRHHLRIVWVVHRLPTIRAQILHRIACIAQIGSQRIFQNVATVVSSNSKGLR